MFCAQCGREMSGQAIVCSHCGWRSSDPVKASPAQPAPYPGQAPGFAPYQAPPPDLGMRMLLPVGRSGYAISAGYLGLISVLGIFGPLAIIFSILAIQDLKKHPEKSGMGRAIFGLVMGCLGSIMLLFMVIAMFSSRR